jgi:hypothetical protein
MSVRVLRAVLVALIVAGAAAVVRAATVPIRRNGRMDLVNSASASPTSAVRETAYDSLLAAARHRPLFRPDRRPPALAFDPGGTQPAGGEPAPSAQPRPQLAVSGIVWGAEPAAIVDGLPGAEGSVVLRRGEASGGIRVRRIELGRVILSGLDTTWTLPVRNPWR